MNGENKNIAESFWVHLDELRSTLMRIVAACIVIGVVAFFFKDELFNIILAPKSSDFITYRLFEYITQQISFVDIGMETFSIKLINTQLAQQFTIHIRMSIYVGLLVIFPYVLYEIFRFISPALYDNERKNAVGIVTSGYVMFILGVLVSYFLIFPLTLRFLGTYQVSPDVENQIALESYISTMMMLNLMMGIMFELPILSWLFAKLGFISAPFLRKYRRHAIIILLVISAFITPTADIITLLLVMCPMYLLYEISILVVACTQKKNETLNTI